MKLLKRLKSGLVLMALHWSGAVMRWALVDWCAAKGWDVTRADEITKREIGAIPQSLEAFFAYQMSEATIVGERLARRFDPGMTLNEVANRAIAAKQVARENPDAMSGPPLTDRQLQALAFQKDYLKRVVDRS